MSATAIAELRDLDQAREFLLQGLWLQRVVAPAPAAVRPALEWALEVASAGQPLPPAGFVADLGQSIFGLGQETRVSREILTAPGLPPGLLSTYEDHVLGKLYADSSFERGGDALRRFQGRDRARGLAFLIGQFRERASFGGVFLSPAVLKALLRAPPETILAEGRERLSRDGAAPALVGLYQGLIAAARRTAEVLGPEDVFELEHGTALDELGQRLALRQVLQALDRLERSLPRHRFRPPPGRQEVPTRVLDEDTYPVGGFASLSTRGSVESLLHSQLAYMEKDRPDLFDVKFLRDELLYYARDDNQFLRRRRTFVFALFPDLVEARFKDAELPWQRIVLLLATLAALVRKLSDWLCTDALTFEFLFLGDDVPLAAERKLLETLFREQLANGTVLSQQESEVQTVAERCQARARRSLVHCLTLSTEDRRFEAEGTLVSALQIAGPRPGVGVGREQLQRPEAEDAFEGWAKVLEVILQHWV